MPHAMVSVSYASAILDANARAHASVMAPHLALTRRDTACAEHTASRNPAASARRSDTNAKAPHRTAHICHISVNTRVTLCTSDSCSCEWWLRVPPDVRIGCSHKSISLRHVANIQSSSLHPKWLVASDLFLAV